MSTQEKEKNNLNDFRQAVNMVFFIIIYIDLIILNLFGYERGSDFYLFYYFPATALITSFSIYLIEEKYKKSFIIFYLSEAFKITHIKYKVLSFIILLVIPIGCIYFLSNY